MEKMNLKILILNQIKRIKKSNKYKVKIKKKENRVGTASTSTASNSAVSE